MGKTVVEVIDGSDAFHKLEPEWKALFRTSPAASPPLSWQWQHEWWRVFGPICNPDGRGLRILAVRRDGQLIGVLPLYLARAPGGRLAARRLCFVSAGEREDEEIFPENLDLLSAPGEDDACLQALEAPLFSSDGIEWDVLELQNVRSDSPLPHWAKHHAASRQARVEQTELASPIADLSDGFEAYLKRKSAKQRSQLRRLLRAEDSPGIAFETASTPREARAFFEEMLNLHLARWKARGRVTALASPRVVQFHAELLERLVPTGEVVMGRLTHHGRALALIHGFVVDGKFDFYQSGVDYGEDVPVSSPGVLAHLLMMRYLATRGVGTYDFLEGVDEYKRRLATGERHLTTLRLFRLTPRWAGYRAYSLGARAVRKLRRTARTAIRGRR